MKKRFLVITALCALNSFIFSSIIFISSSSAESKFDLKLDSYKIAIPSTWDKLLCGTKDEAEAKKRGLDLIWHFRTPASSKAWLFFDVGMRKLPSKEDASALDDAVERKLFFQQNIKEQSNIKIIEVKNSKYQGKYSAKEVTYSYYNVDLLHDDNGKPVAEETSRRETARAIIFLASSNLWILNASANSGDFEKAISEDFKTIFESFETLG